jgi:hypothetical protein
VIPQESFARRPGPCTAMRHSAISLAKRPAFFCQGLPLASALSASLFSLLRVVQEADLPAARELLLHHSSLHFILPSQTSHPLSSSQTRAPTWITFARPDHYHFAAVAADNYSWEDFSASCIRLFTRRIIHHILNQKDASIHILCS